VRPPGGVVLKHTPQIASKKGPFSSPQNIPKGGDISPNMLVISKKDKPKRFFPPVIMGKSFLPGTQKNKR